MLLLKGTRGILLLQTFHFIDEETEAQKGKLSGPRSHSPSVHQSPGFLGPESGLLYHMLGREIKGLSGTFLPCAQEERRPSGGHLSPASSPGLTSLFPPTASDQIAHNGQRGHDTPQETKQGIFLNHPTCPRGKKIKTLS